MGQNIPGGVKEIKQMFREQVGALCSFQRTRRVGRWGGAQGDGAELG